MASPAASNTVGKLKIPHFSGLFLRFNEAESAILLTRPFFGAGRPMSSCRTLRGKHPTSGKIDIRGKRAIKIIDFLISPDYLAFRRRKPSH